MLINSRQETNSDTADKEIFLTIDVDWAADFVLEATLDIIEKENTAATFFITHQTPLLERIRDNKNWEMGIHPNYNRLLEGDMSDGCAGAIVNSLMRIVPEARSVRGHSLGQSSRIMELYRRHGITHTSDMYVPAESGIVLKPYLYYNGLTVVPYMWADDAHCLKNTKDWRPDFFLNRPGLLVFDFHPIHIYLNTPELSVYEQARPYMKIREELPKHICSGAEIGTRTFLLELIGRARSGGFKFKRVSEVKAG